MLYFKPTIMHNNETITSDHRKFECLVEEYLKACYPLAEWKITSSTKDGNKDVEGRCILTGKNMWAEAKYTKHDTKNLPSRKFDSTLVSSNLNRNVISIFLMSNTTFGNELTCRVRGFCYLSPVESVVFIDGTTLLLWINQNKRIQDKFIANWTPLEKSKHIRLRRVYIFHQEDTYIINSVREINQTIPLFSWKNYIIEAEIESFGYLENEITILCNDIPLHQDNRVHHGISSFRINEVFEMLVTQNTRNLHLRFIAMTKDSRIELGEVSLAFSPPDVFLGEQLRAFDDMWQSVQIGFGERICIYGKSNTGKSWLLNKLRCDLLRQNNSIKVIYIPFTGTDYDVALLCRFLFTLVFDYYNITISADALKRFSLELNMENTLFAPNLLSIIIESLSNNDHAYVRSLLKGTASSSCRRIFKMSNHYNHQRIYLLDDVHLLQHEDKCVFDNILLSFESSCQTSIVFTDRTASSHAERNISVNTISERSLIELFNNYSEFYNVKTISQLLPQEHGLEHPGLARRFFRDIQEQNSDIIGAQRYYANIFSKIVDSHRSEMLVCGADDALLLVAIITSSGIPEDMFSPSLLHSWIDMGYLRVHEGLVYANRGRFKKENIKHEVKKHQTIVRDTLQRIASMGFIDEIKLIHIAYEYLDEKTSVAESRIFHRAEKLFNQNEYREVCNYLQPIIDNGRMEDEDKFRHALYYHAVSLLHFSDIREALSLLESLKRLYLDGYLKKDDLFFNVLAEIIDIKFWSWEMYDSIFDDIKSFFVLWERYRSPSYRKKRAYRTVANRNMMALYAVDDIVSATIWYEKNIQLGIDEDNSEHIGYSKMDCAKSLYHIDLHRALHLLLEARTIFEQKDHEYRRLLDCCCEIAYVKLLLGEVGFEEFEISRNGLYHAQYWTQFYKSSLKLCAYHILHGNVEDSHEALVEARNSLALKDNERAAYFMLLFEMILTEQRLARNLKIPQGSIYQKLSQQIYARDNNIRMFRLNNCVEGYFYLDPRIW